MSFSINSDNFFRKGTDPNVYAQQYADTKGISVEEAKKELRAKHGDPPAQVQNQEIPQFNSYNTSAEDNGKDFDQQLKDLGIPAALVESRDRAAIEDYAQQNNIQLPQPPDGARLNLLS